MLYRQSSVLDYGLKALKINASFHNSYVYILKLII